MAGYRNRVLALFERNPTALMVAMRDGHHHVLGVTLHPDLVLGVDEMPLRMAIVTMARHQRKCWLAVEVGYLDDVSLATGTPLAVERFTEPMTIEECADYYGYATETARVYLSRARRHLRERLDGDEYSQRAMARQDGLARLLAQVLKQD